jgi:large subunit ribosomal protein L29e
MGLTQQTRRPKITWVTNIRSIELGFAGVVELQSEREMAKSKNHTAHNQSYKAHKNGIKKPKRHRHTSTKGVCIHSFSFFSFYPIFFFVNNNNNSLLLSIDYCRWILSFWGIRGTLGSTTRKMVKSPLLKND